MQGLFFFHYFCIMFKLHLCCILNNFCNHVTISFRQLYIRLLIHLLILNFFTTYISLLNNLVLVYNSILLCNLRINSLTTSNTFFNSCINCARLSLKSLCSRHLFTITKLRIQSSFLIYQFRNPLLRPIFICNLPNQFWLIYLLIYFTLTQPITFFLLRR